MSYFDNYIIENYYKNYSYYYFFIILYSKFIDFTYYNNL